MIRNILIWLALLAGSAQAETRLLMLDRVGCIYCDRWTAEIGDIYPKTDAGQQAPLTRLDHAAPLPDGIKTEGRAVYTPTFILVHDGVETGRIEGYPGEDFFWGLLEKMLSDLPEHQHP